MPANTKHGDSNAPIPALRQSGRTRKITQKAVESAEAIGPGLRLSLTNDEDVPETTTLPAMPPNDRSRVARPPPGSPLEELLGPDKFMIYPWPAPRPKDFTAPPPSHRGWKVAQDARDEARDVDDGSDEWYAFSDDGDRRCIARAFVNRAKRAFWARRPWSGFAEAERSSYNEAEAKQRSSIVMSNKLRLEVWHALKGRLCEEIWGQPCVDARALVKLSLGKKAGDRTVTTAKGSAKSKRRILPPTEEEAGCGVAGWSVDPDGTQQPFYEGEIEAPNGLARFMQEMREENARAPTPKDCTSGSTKSSCTERRVAWRSTGSLDMETSDEDEADSSRR